MGKLVAISDLAPTGRLRLTPADVTVAFARYKELKQRPLAGSLTDMVCLTTMHNNKQGALFWVFGSDFVFFFGLVVFDKHLWSFLVTSYWTCIPKVRVQGAPQGPPRHRSLLLCAVKITNQTCLPSFPIAPLPWLHVLTNQNQSSHATPPPHSLKKLGGHIKFAWFRT